MKNALLALLALVPLAGRAAPAAPTARATIQNAQGADVGTATFREVPGGIEVKLDAKGLPPGKHGMHLHAVGKCEAPDFKTAGGHFNPGGKKHGTGSADGPHSGDLPNLTVGPDGKGTATGVLRNATFGEGATSILAGAGTAVVIHADADDDKTDPAGNSGARVACGVVKKG